MSANVGETSFGTRSMPKRWLKRGALGLLYAGAGLTALQRIDDDKHWAPDVFLGLVNGFTVGEMLCHARE